MIAAVRADERPVCIVEIKMARQLLRCRIADEATIAQGLLVREKADRHCSAYAAILG